MELMTLLGAVGGGVLRFAPEVLNWLDRNNLRKHELAMQDKALAFEKLRGSQRMEEIQGANQNSLDTGGLLALNEAIRAQGTLTSIGWVDAVNSTVRPFLTYYWCVVMVTIAFSCQVYNAGGDKAGFATAFLSVWGPDEKMIVSGMLNFWFLDRAIRWNKGR